MIGVVRWVEEGGLSFLKGGKCNTKDSVSCFFPIILVPRKETLWVRAELVLVKGALKRSTTCTGQMGCHTGKLTVPEFFVIGKS